MINLSNLTSTKTVQPATRRLARYKIMCYGNNLQKELVEKELEVEKNQNDEDKKAHLDKIVYVS